MTFTNKKNAVLKFSLLISMTFFFTVLSCSKDETVPNNIDDSLENTSNEEDSNSGDTNDESSNENDTTFEKIFFESNLSLDESRSVLSYVIT